MQGLFTGQGPVRSRICFSQTGNMKRNKQGRWKLRSKLFSVLMISSTMALMAGCSSESGSGSSAGVGSLATDGTSSVTFKGPVSRTTAYGSDPNTAVYCARGKTSYLVSLMEKGENRNNSGWSMDGVFFSFYQSSRPQDVSEVGLDGSTRVYAVIKEITEGSGTFHIGAKACTFRATVSGSRMDGRFECQGLTGAKGRELNVHGWFECNIRNSESLM